MDTALARLGETATAGIDALVGESAERFTDTVTRFTKGLGNLEAATGLEILSDTHRKLDQLAQSCGAVYKPCGAGGGDVGLAFSTDPESVAALHNLAVAAGFKILDIGCDGTGLTVRRAPAG